MKMPKQRLLFLDDRTKRIHAALNQYGEKYDVTICANVLECLRLLSSQDWDIVSLDFDLGGVDFVDPESANSGNAILRYISTTGWPVGKPKPVFWVHSKNVFAGQAMTNSLNVLNLKATYRPFVYETPEEIPYKKGILAGAFDLIHPGYVRLFKDAKRICDYLIIALHEDPSVERPNKLPPLMSISERTEILLSIRFVNQIVSYRTEEDLYNLIKKMKPEVIIVGDDHKDTEVTGSDLGIPIHYHVRSTNWSTTKLKRDICVSMEKQE